ncbi:MAG TPA: hypothetical protein VFD27_02990 [Chthoniobacteraceae bacterium]|nr:hypothetical protein [Chthoniobacteraceae bacterium]
MTSLISAILLMALFGLLLRSVRDSRRDAATIRELRLALNERDARDREVSTAGFRIGYDIGYTAAIEIQSIAREQSARKARLN